MKRVLLAILFVSLTTCLFGQSSFSNGYQKGFKEGYCYQDYGCIAPIPPITPIPKISESDNSYKDGYQRGFLEGQSSKKGTNNTFDRFAPRKYGEYIKPYDMDLLYKALEVKQAKYDRAIYNARLQKQEIERIQKEKAVSRMNQIISYYNSATVYPKYIKDGWHMVFSMNNYNFCDQRKVFVENNRVTEYVVDNYSRRTVTYSLPITDGKTSIKIAESKEELVNLYFLEYISDPDSYTEAPTPSGKVSFWKSFEGGGQIDVWVDGKYIGLIKHYFNQGFPSCGQVGTLVFQGKHGVKYNYVAKSSRLTWSGSFYGDSGGCKKLQLNN